MKVSTSTSIYEYVRWGSTMFYSLEDSIRACAAAGYEVLDMAFNSYSRKGRALAQPDWEDWLKRHKDIACELGLEWYQGHAHFYDWSTAGPAEREFHEEMVRRSIIGAGIMGVQWLVIHPGTIYDETWYAYRKSLQANLEAYRRYGELAAKHNVGIAIENMMEAPNRRRLPDRFDALTQSVLESAMQRRPDLLASYATLKAGEAQVAAAKAGMMPKVFVAGTLASNSSKFNVGNLPDIGSPTAQSSMLVVASVPLFDGGLRAAQIKNAQVGADAAAETFRRVQLAAISEIVIASNTLATALQANKAASVLVQTSTTAFDAAMEAYRNGLGTVVIVNETNSALLDARLTKADAEVAVLISAANLAFFTGALTSADKIPGTVTAR